jgi:hypothetical protein
MVTTTSQGQTLFVLKLVFNVRHITNMGHVTLGMITAVLLVLTPFIHGIVDTTQAAVEVEPMQGGQVPLPNQVTPTSVEREEQVAEPTDSVAVTAVVAEVPRALVQTALRQGLVQLLELAVKDGLVLAWQAALPSSIMGRDEYKTVGLLPSRTCQRPGARGSLRHLSRMPVIY